jgi:hypothetical protein
MIWYNINDQRRILQLLPDTRMVLAMGTMLKPETLLEVLGSTWRWLAMAWQKVSSDLLPDTRLALTMGKDIPYPTILAIKTREQIKSLYIFMKEAGLAGHHSHLPGSHTSQQDPKAK